MDTVNENAVAELESQAVASNALGVFKPYNNQLDIPEIADTRIVKCLYKISSTAGKKVNENAYVRIPVSHLTEETVQERVQEFMPYFISYLQEIEDGMIKEDHKAGVTSVYIEGLTLDKLLQALEEKECGARLNKEKIEAWFNNSLQDSLIVLFADKLGLSDNPTEQEQAKLIKILTAYKAKFASLASGKTIVNEQDCEAMKKVINSAGAQDTFIGSRLLNRLNNMKQKEDDLLMSL